MYDVRVRTSYSRRKGDYAYDVEVHEVLSPATAGRYCAQVVNMVRRHAGDTMSVDPGLPDVYGATPDEAFSKIEAAVETWVKDQTRPT
jgi:hypothetical protein